VIVAQPPAWKCVPRGLCFLARYTESLRSEEAQAEWLVKAETVAVDLAARYFAVSGAGDRGPHALLEHVASYKDVGDAQRKDLLQATVTSPPAQCGYDDRTLDATSVPQGEYCGGPVHAAREARVRECLSRDVCRSAQKKVMYCNPNWMRRYSWEPKEEGSRDDLVLSLPPRLH
jgi:hypothetical protein